MNNFLIIIFFLFTFSINAQIHEIGVFLGGSNYVGDVGVTTYVSPKEPAYGILYKWNKSPRHSYRFSYTQTKIIANDYDSNEPSRTIRGYFFKNNIKEVSLGLEFNFFEFNLHEIEKKLTPYIYSGLNFVFYDNLYLNSSSIITEGKINSSIAIPMNLGVKSNINPHTVLAFEVGARYTFTDNMDGSNPKDQNKTKFGNINNNDWYVFSGLTLTYTFGNTPCYCAE